MWGFVAPFYPHKAPLTGRGSSGGEWFREGKLWGRVVSGR